jgi:hypothetical protein
VDDCAGYDCKALAKVDQGSGGHSGGSGGGTGGGGRRSGCTVVTPGKPVLEQKRYKVRKRFGSEEQVVLKWTPVLEADAYQLQVMPLGTDCNDERAFCGFLGARETSFRFTLRAPEYFVRVRAVNVRCGGVEIDEKNVEDLIPRGKVRLQRRRR